MLVYQFREQWTRASYLRAIDVWTMGSYILCFYTVIEYCIVIVLTKADRISSDQSKIKKISIKNPRKIFDQSKASSLSWKFQLALMIERSSKMIVPIYLLVFTMAYFIVCLSAN